MKKRFAFIAAAVVGCAVLLSGCASSNSVNLVPLNSNWYAITTFKGFQPTFTEENKEELVYAVTFTEPQAGNTSYSVKYGDGTYKTEFYTTEFDVSALTYADYKSGYPESATVYYYRTELDIPSVTFTVGGESKTFEGDKRITECYFLSCENYLQPLYSKFSISCTTPANQVADSVENAYKKFDREIVNYYNYSGTEVRSVVTDNLNNENSSTFTQGISASTSFFDNQSLDIVIRAMSNLSTSLSQSISLYSADAGVYAATLSGTADNALTDLEKESITKILSDNGLYKAKTDLSEGEKDYASTVAVNVTYNGSLTGVSQTYWYAAISNKLNNTSRATMVKLSTPVPYALGTLNFTLSEINGTLWND